MAYDPTVIPSPITYHEPDRLLRRLRQHDLAALRCLWHGKPPQVSPDPTGLTIGVCCPALAEAVRHVLGMDQPFGPTFQRTRT